MAKRKVGTQNYQFDSRPQKVKNQLDFHACRWRVTCCWKFLDESCNFVSDLILIGVEHEIIAPQSCKSSNPGRDKKPFGCGPHGEVQSILYGGRWWLPPSPNHGESCEAKVTHGLSKHQRCSNIVLTNSWLVGCRFVWVNKLIVIFPSPIMELQQTPLPLKVLRARERALSS